MNIEVGLVPSVQISYILNEVSAKVTDFAPEPDERPRQGRLGVVLNFYILF